MYKRQGFDDTTIESEGWFESVKNTSYYSLSPINNGVGELTLKANSLGTNQSINNEINQQNTTEKYFSNIDSELNSSFLRGVLNNMIEKNSSYANISISETKVLNIDLLGYDTLKNNCILGEISNKNNTINWAGIESVLNEWKPKLILVGKPLNMDGSDSDIMEKVNIFFKKLEKISKIPCEYVDERLTSFEESHKDRAVRAMTTATGLKPITCS